MGDNDKWIFQSNKIVAHDRFGQAFFVLDKLSNSVMKRMVFDHNTLKAIKDPIKAFKRIYEYLESMDDSYCTCGADDWPSTADGGDECGCYYHELKELFAIKSPEKVEEDESR